jgi:hypothetical protein
MSTLTINDNGVDRPMTPEELAEHERNIAQIQADETKNNADAAAALEARKAPLRRLGLTEDEINTVLGL